MSRFADRKYVEVIRQALWSHREFGRAAVMVGAGFSRNADPCKVSARPIPLWADLTRMLVESLDPPPRGSDEHRRALAKAEETSRALRLAEEFEAALGRQRLDSWLLERVPDDDYRPGRLHRLLLQLPWADVFTTNYDTLLERAAPRVVGRRYDVVRAQGEVPSAMRPRIVKLHGTFPSNPPFVFTEEDFRTYPRRFAAFVNLVQQAMTENVFCLLGFSGDDPNFLYWTGWVRDHLGDTAPRLYLCGLLSLNDSQRRLLDRRNVTPIDLTPLFPREKFPDPGLRHRLALEWFLLSLEAGRPPDPLSWPRSGEPLTAPSPELGPETPPVPPSEGGPAPEELFPRCGTADVEPQARIWGANRGRYPGWLVAPGGVRSRLVTYTRSWLQPALAALPALPPERQLQVLDELNWRLETALLPLWPDLVTAVTSCLEAINPFPERLDLPRATLKLGPDTIDRADPGWQEIKHRWTDLAFALLRFWREERRHEEFARWAGRLDAIPAGGSSHVARLSYERCLAALGRMDDDEGRRWLAGWPPVAGDPFWAVRRAAVLAELGELGEARALVEDAIAELRVGLRHTTDEIPTLSREGWAMRLSQALDHARWSPGGGEQQDYRGRWQQLGAFGCNPSPELELLRSRLDGPVPLPRPSVSRATAFQPGVVTESHYFGDDLWEKLSPGYQYMRLSELAASPPVWGTFVLAAPSLKTFGLWCVPHDPVRTRSLICRLLDQELIEAYLSRHRVAALPAEAVGEFHALARRAIGQALQGVRPRADADEGVGRRSEARLCAAVEILGRIAVRLPGEELSELWATAAALLHSATAWACRSLPGRLVNLFKSLILSMGPGDLQGRLLQLMSLPLPGSPAPPDGMSEEWPELAPDVRRRLHHLPRQGRGENWSEVAGSLLKAAAGGNEGARGRALLRLSILYDYGRLKPAEVRRLAKVYWDKINAATGLPEAPGLRNWVCLALPEPEPGLSVERFRRYALATELPPVEGGTADAGGLARDWLEATDHPGRPRDPRGRRRFVDWTPEEAAGLLDRITGWWGRTGRREAGEASSPAPGVAFTRRPVGERVSLVLDVLRRVVVPRTPPGSATPDKVLAHVADLEQHGMPVEAALPALLLLRNEQILPRLRRALASSNTGRYVGALRGVLYWVEGHHLPRKGKAHPRLPPVPYDLLHEVGMIVAGRRQPGLLPALEVTEAVLDHSPEAADERFRLSVVVGLEYLLTEAAYRAAEDPDPRVPYDDVPECRRRAARIASLFRSLFDDDSAVVAQWIDAGRGDPLPEVRQAVEDPAAGAEG